MTGSEKPVACLSMDVDTLRTLLRDAYTGPDDTFIQGLNACRTTLAEFGLKATFFVVAKDLEDADARAAVKRLSDEGHEIGSHSYDHPQGLTLMESAQIEEQLARAETLIETAVGRKPRGFRAPCWNLDARVFRILAGRGYLYDASVFPTWTAPAMKAVYRWYWRKFEKGPARGTVLGDWRLMLAPRLPYRPDPVQVWKRGGSKLAELPVATTPYFRLPCYGTTLIEWGEGRFDRMYRSIRERHEPFLFQMHLTEWMEDQTERIRLHRRTGVPLYVPRACRRPLEEKRTLYRRLFENIQRDFRPLTMEALAREMGR